MSNQNEWKYTLDEVTAAYESGYHRGKQDERLVLDADHWRAMAVRNVIIAFLSVAVVVLVWGLAWCKG